MKQWMKFLSLMLCLVMILGVFSACHSDDKSDAQEITEEKPEDDSTGSTDNNWGDFPFNVSVNFYYNTPGEFVTIPSGDYPGAPSITIPLSMAESGLLPDPLQTRECFVCERLLSTSLASMIFPLLWRKALTLRIP